jgi:ABC-2 type transport system permease protein
MPGTIAWYARHDARLAWRDWIAMLTAGGRWRIRTLAVASLAFVAGMHLLAWAMIGRFAHIGLYFDKRTLVVVTGILAMTFLLLVSQAMESATRAFYARGDLELILSSPAAARKIFVVRIATMALSVTALAALFAAPFINVLATAGGAQWLAAYGMVVAMGAAATALALVLVITLFRSVGPKRARLSAQVVAAVMGATVVIALQLGAILSSGTMSRFALLQSRAFIELAPDIDRAFWGPARAALGDLTALVVVLPASLALLAISIAIYAPRFADHVMAATSIANSRTRALRWSTPFRQRPPRRTLRRKEWMLLLRDPWLLSQTLMQLLYLLPPAVLLWRSFGDGSGALVLLVPVLVMAAGQLAGGLAWLAICGEDAPDLVASAPIAAGVIVRAKIEAVIGGIALVFAPFLVVLAVASPLHASVAAIGIVVAAAASTAIQFWFRAQAKRSHFRRRQTASRVATFAEAFSSISWAATAALAAAGSTIALATALIGFVVLAGARLLSPHAP